MKNVWKQTILRAELYEGTSLRSMIYDWYQFEPKVKRIIPGDNPGITVLVLKELY